MSMATLHLLNHEVNLNVFLLSLSFHLFHLVLFSSMFHSLALAATQPFGQVSTSSLRLIGLLVDLHPIIGLQLSCHLPLFGSESLHGWSRLNRFEQDLGSNDAIWNDKRPPRTT